MRTVVWSGRGLVQLKAAIDYLAERNLVASQRLEARIAETVANLARRPIGRPGHQPETYEKRITDTPYLIVHELVGGPEGDLRILRLFHLSQDWTGWKPGPDDIA